MRGAQSTRGAILESVRRGRATTRRDLTELTGASRSAVAQAVADLVAEGLLTEYEGEREARRGRPSTRLRAGGGHGLVVAIDLGHEHLAVAVRGLDHQLASERRQPFPVDDDPDAAVLEADRLLGSLLAEHGARRANIRAVGIAVPFPVLPQEGRVADLRGRSTRDRARPWDLLAVPAGAALVLDNNANLGAWGEQLHEVDPAVRTLVYVRAGSGLGTGLVVDGAIFGGYRSGVGEVGHVVVPGCTVVCRCGRVGCLDGLVREASRPSASPADVVAAGRAVGVATAQLAAFVAPDAVVLGGPLGVGSGVFASTARRAFDESAPPELGGLVRAPRAGVRAELWGALDRATQEAWSHVSSW